MVIKLTVVRTTSRQNAQEVPRALRLAANESEDSECEKASSTRRTNATITVRNDARTGLRPRHRTPRNKGSAPGQSLKKWPEIKGEARASPLKQRWKETAKAR